MRISCKRGKHWGNNEQIFIRVFQKDCAVCKMRALILMALKLAKDHDSANIYMIRQ